MTDTLALAVDTRLGGRAVLVAAAAEYATAADARLIQLALRMRDAGHHASIVDTLLAVRTIGDRSTHG